MHTPNTDNQKPYVFHPQYGLGDAYRLRVLMHSVAHGVVQAAKVHNVSTAAVYNWRKQYSKAFSLSKKG